jgi:hypothetical protein
VIPTIVGGVLVLTALVAIVVFMVRGPVAGGPADRLANTPGISSFGPFVNGAVASIALGTALSGATTGWPAGAVIGACVGILFAALSGTGQFQQLGIQVLSGMFGVLGLVVVVTRYLEVGPDSCATVPLWERILSTCILIGFLGFGILIAGLRHMLRLKFSSALAAFGAFKVVAFLATPLGISVFELGWPGWVVAIAASAILGFASGISPDFVVGIAGIALTVIAFLAPATMGTTCTAAPNLTDVPSLGGFIVIYFLVRFAVGRLLHRSR